MKELSNYQKKQMTAKEIQAYAKAMIANDPEVIVVWGGEIVISKDEDCLLVECIDHDGSLEDHVYVEDRDEADEYIERYTDLLADYEPEDES